MPGIIEFPTILQQQVAHAEWHQELWRRFRHDVALGNSCLVVLLTRIGQNNPVPRFARAQMLQGVIYF
jgi:hypothetical protein